MELALKVVWMMTDELSFSTNFVDSIVLCCHRGVDSYTLYKLFTSEIPISHQDDHGLCQQTGSELNFISSTCMETITEHVNI